MDIVLSMIDTEFPMLSQICHHYNYFRLNEGNLSKMDDFDIYIYNSESKQTRHESLQARHFRFDPRVMK